MIHKVQVWLVRGRATQGREVLLLKTVPSRGAFWQPITGAVEAGESSIDAVVREVSEETGFILERDRVQSLDYSFEFLGRWGAAREEVFFIVLNEEVENQETLRLDLDEHSDFCWVKLSQAISFLIHTQVRASLERLEGFFKKIE